MGCMYRQTALLPSTGSQGIGDPEPQLRSHASCASGTWCSVMQSTQAGMQGWSGLSCHWHVGPAGPAWYGKHACHLIRGLVTRCAQACCTTKSHLHSHEASWAQSLQRVPPGGSLAPE